MPVFASTGKNRRNIRFPSGQRLTGKQQKPNLQVHRPSSTSRTSLVHQPGKMAEGQAARAGIPTLFTEPPPVQDPLVTETTELQNETLEKCLPYLKGIHDTQQEPFNHHGVPALQRPDHLEYLYDSLEDYPAGFAGLDASRPWMVYWALAALSLLGEDVSKFRDRYDLTLAIHGWDFLIFSARLPRLLPCKIQLVGSGVVMAKFRIVRLPMPSPFPWPWLAVRMPTG